MKPFAPLCAAALLSLAVPASSQETVLRLSSWLPPSHPIVADMVLPWAADVEEATEGRVTVQLLDAALGPPPAAFDLAQTGAADLTFGVHGYTPGRFTLNQLAELPFLTPDATSASVAYQRLTDGMLADVDEHRGVKLLGVFVHGPGMLWMSSRDAGSADAIEGAKVRVAGKVSNDMVSGMGMVPLQAPASQAYEILSGGVADGIVFPAESPTFFRLNDILQNGMETEGGLYNVSFFFVMNQGSFDRLSAEDQAAIEALSGEAFARRAGAAWDAADAAGLEAMGDGMTIAAADDAMRAVIEQAAEPVYADVRAAYEAKGIDFDAALDAYRASTAEVAAE